MLSADHRHLVALRLRIRAVVVHQPSLDTRPSAHQIPVNDEFDGRIADCLNGLTTSRSRVAEWQRLPDTYRLRP